MSLVQELRTVITAYLADDETVDDLEDWLASHVQALADERNKQAHEMADEAWILVDEYRRGLVTQTGLRQGLRELTEIFGPAPVQP